MTDNNEKVIPNVDSKSKEERNVPDLRFNGYADNWKNVKLKNILKIKSGQDQKNIQCDDGIYNIYGTGGVIGKTNEYLYNKESVGIGRKGTIDRPFYFNEPFWTVDTLFYSEIHFGVPKFIYYLFQTINWNLYNQSTGVPSLTSSVIENINVDIPDVDEQTKLSFFLTIIDSRIETQKKIIGDYKLLLNSIRNKKLGYYDANNTHSTLDNYLIEYCKKTEQNDLYPVLSSTKDGIYLQSEYFNKEAASEDTTGYKILPRNYCTYRSMSDTGSFTFNKQTIIDNGIISPAYPVFTSKINNDFLIEYLNNSSYFKSSLLEMKEGGTRFALSYSKLLKLKIVDISIHEQDNYINIINSYKNIIINEEKILSLLEKQKQYLLNKMFI